MPSHRISHGVKQGLFSNAQGWQTLQRNGNENLVSNNSVLQLAGQAFFSHWEYNCIKTILQELNPRERKQTKTQSKSQMYFPWRVLLSQLCTVAGNLRFKVELGKASLEQTCRMSTRMEKNIYLKNTWNKLQKKSHKKKVHLYSILSYINSK